ncbi:MAG: histidinol-phosphatase [Clostridia bacterium]
MKDLHVHTTFCDGKNTPEEMVIQAIEKGIETIGFSAHSYTFFDESYCMKKERYKEYKAEIKRLQEKYRGKIEILLGIEQDFYSDASTEGFDYVIGSVHYLKKNGKYLPIDESEEIFIDIVKNYYNNDFYLLAEDYFDTVSSVVEKTGADIIGHFDLITKFNEKNRLFDEGDERYVKAYKKAVDKLIETGKVFEINTGAISRGYRTTPYPSEDILKYILQKGGRTMVNSDSHSVDGLGM